LVADVLVLNQAAALERMPGNLWGFHWNSLSGNGFCLGKYRSGPGKKESPVILYNYILLRRPA
jgi:hypothetical protein